MVYELVKVYSHLNENLFDGVLHNPLFETNFKLKSVFHFDSANPKKILIGSQIFNVGTPHQLYDELLHCMIHIKNWECGIIDKEKTYHKKPFVKMALSKGLFVSRTPSRGWGNVSSEQLSGDSLVPDCMAHEKLTEIYRGLNFDITKLGKLRKEKKRVFLLKYVCKCSPPNSVRSGKRPDSVNCLDITCNRCKEKFVCEV